MKFALMVVLLLLFLSGKKNPGCSYYIVAFLFSWLIANGIAAIFA